jgi:hypothetical protein
MQISVKLLLYGVLAHPILSIVALPPNDLNVAVGDSAVIDGSYSDEGLRLLVRDKEKVTPSWFPVFNLSDNKLPPRNNILFVALMGVTVVDRYEFVPVEVLGVLCVYLKSIWHSKVRSYSL